MRLLLQRVLRAEVRVGGRVTGRYGPGLAILVGIGQADDVPTVEAMAKRVIGLRIFRDDAGRTNRSLADVGGSALAVSQFTLYADASRGRRPSFVAAAEPAVATELYERFAAALEARGIAVGRGVFGAEMELELVNDGPFTIWLDSALR